MGLAGLGPIVTPVELPEGFPMPERHDLKDADPISP